MQKPSGLLIAGVLMFGMSLSSMAEEKTASAEQMKEITAYCKAESAGAITPEAFMEECIADQVKAVSGASKEEKDE
jgi:hypothetical protein